MVTSQTATIHFGLTYCHKLVITVLWKSIPEPTLSQCSIFIPPKKPQKNPGFLILSGGIEIERWFKMG